MSMEQPSIKKLPEGGYECKSEIASARGNTARAAYRRWTERALSAALLAQPQGGAELTALESPRSALVVVDLRQPGRLVHRVADQETGRQVELGASVPEGRKGARKTVKPKRAEGGQVATPRVQAPRAVYRPGAKLRAAAELAARHEPKLKSLRSSAVFFGGVQ